MAKNSNYKSDAFEAIHSAAEGLYRSGSIDLATIREFDESCLTVPTSIDAVAIKNLREANRVSQPVFARYVNTSESTVAKWESGAKKPSGSALKLLALIQKHGIDYIA